MKVHTRTIPLRRIREIFARIDADPIPGRTAHPVGREPRRPGPKPLRRLGALFRVAAVSPHTAVYLPLRTNKISECDLLVLRDDVHMRPPLCRPSAPA
ncbi:MAG TPA: hypothetical protein VFC19_38295 [Candidatus Limnocylindrales bacterium]|nr:hypothetical protein [Candidatus Limnocylindrales bacterium]